MIIELYNEMNGYWDLLERNKLDGKIIELTRQYIATITFGPITNDVVELLTYRPSSKPADTVRQSPVEFTP